MLPRWAPGRDGGSRGRRGRRGLRRRRVRGASARLGLERRRGQERREAGAVDCCGGVVLARSGSRRRRRLFGSAAAATTAVGSDAIGEREAIRARPLVSAAKLINPNLSQRLDRVTTWSNTSNKDETKANSCICAKIRNHKIHHARKLQNSGVNKPFRDLCIEFSRQRTEIQNEKLQYLRKER